MRSNLERTHGDDAMTPARKRLEEPRTKIAELFTRPRSSGIRITRESGIVRLQGLVRSWAERTAAREAAWKLPGVTAVEDWLTVDEHHA
jgi:hypothetical protein